MGLTAHPHSMQRVLWGEGGGQFPRPPPRTPLPTPFMKGLGEGVWGRGRGLETPGPLPHHKLLRTG